MDGQSALPQDIFNVVESGVDKRPGQVGELIGPKKYLEPLGQPFRTAPLAYVGSDTTPPCKPGLIWLVSRDLHPVTKQQVSQ